MISVLTKFHLPKFSMLLVIAIKPKDIENFAEPLCFYFTSYKNITSTKFAHFLWSITGRQLIVSQLASSVLFQITSSLSRHVDFADRRKLKCVALELFPVA
jgi:hypothetical protein